MVGVEQRANTVMIQPMLEVSRGWIDPLVQRRQMLLEEVSSLHQFGLFPITENLETFLGREIIQDEEPALQVEAFLHLKREQLRDGELNPINFIAATARAALAHSLEMTSEVELRFDAPAFQFGFGGVIDDLVAYVSEHPLAEVGERRKIIWNWEKAGDEWKLRGQQGYLDDTISNALTSSQIAPFEELRYLLDKAIYEELKKDRGRFLEGEVSEEAPRAFLQFSPSPAPMKEMLTEDMGVRGYLGNSCVFIFQYDPIDKREIVEQQWFKANWLDFKPLLTDLYGDEWIGLTDLKIISASNFFAPEQIHTILTFVDQHQSKAKHRSKLTGYVKNELPKYIKDKLEYILKQGAQKLIVGADITYELDQITAVLQMAQEFNLKPIIESVTGLKLTRVNAPRWEIEQAENDPIYRAQFVKRYQVPFSGCGGSKNLLIDKVTQIIDSLSMNTIVGSFSPWETGFMSDLQSTPDTSSVANHSKNCSKCKGKLGPCGECDSCASGSSSSH